MLTKRTLRILIYNVYHLLIQFTNVYVGIFILEIEIGLRNNTHVHNVKEHSGYSFSA